MNDEHKEQLKEFQEMTNDRFDRIELKLDSLMSFRSMLIGASAVTSALIGFAIQYWLKWIYRVDWNCLSTVNRVVAGSNPAWSKETWSGSSAGRALWRFQQNYPISNLWGPIKSISRGRFFISPSHTGIRLSGILRMISGPVPTTLWG